MEETVTLPDATTHYLVHPLDLPEARDRFRNSWLVGACTSLPVATLVAAIVGYLSLNWFGPVVVFLALSIFGALAARWFSDRAWDYIPRKRQDRDRPLPRLWELGSAAVLALVLGAALLLIVFRLDNADVSVPVRAYTFGMCAVTALLVLGDAIFGLIRPAGRRRALAGLPGVAVVVFATVLAYAQWFDNAVSKQDILWGAITMAAAAVLVGAARFWDRRTTAASIAAAE
ncbi:hypothetical protein GCM10010435_05550 [Winogradskya consettensis]|uniref:Uncharacterized protein n=1 Tax=Winogradskya consettensis TaxID=113560 RepID=A0A919SY51_9ACTN|nr:hypothetical protein [Actinoplanes consettensis]GIM79502.1 hypothetical protein Aco04nite_65820 [Actinoplanes consettensis]